MTDYLIKSSLCLGILLLTYHLFLEHEKMHRFNRIFLLFSIAFGLLIPQLSLFSYEISKPVTELIKTRESAVQPVLATAEQTATSATTPHWTSILLTIYVIGAFVLALRFAVNILRIYKRIRSSRIVRAYNTKMVLIKEPIVPHSFLGYLFVNEDAYINKRLAPEIINHELSHLRQKHTLDILFIELLKIIFWFNPIFILYKKAIQLNHEFLADEYAISFSGDVRTYQNILLQTAGMRTVLLANNLNYSLTKKRLLMMKKHNSPKRTMLKELALLPLFTMLVFLFSNSIAQEQPGTMPKDEFYKAAQIGLPSADNKLVMKKYEDMSAAERNTLPNPVSPSESLINKWKAYEPYPLIVNSRLPESTGGPLQCRIFIDGKNVSSETLDQYKPEDFASYHDSKFTQGKFSLVSVNLYTTKYLRSLPPESKIMMVYEGQTLVGAPNPPFSIPQKYLN